MQQISVIAGPASRDLAERIAKNLDAKLVNTELKVFSDGESKITITDKIEQKCVIIQSTYPPADSHILQLLMIAKKCIDGGAQDICAIIPYLAYARQDRVFLEGEVVSIALIAKLIEAVGIKHVMTVDIHSKVAVPYFASGLTNISSIPLLANFATSKMNLQKPIVVSPDAGGIERAGEFSRILDTDMISLKKSRDRKTGDVKIDENININISGRDAILIDDMISSGGSIIRAAEVLQKKGAEKIYAMCAHALLLDNAVRKIKAAGGNDIIATNSIPGEWAKVDLSHTISEELKNLYALA